MIRKGKYQQRSEARLTRHKLTLEFREHAPALRVYRRLLNASSTWRARLIRGRPHLSPPDYSSNGRPPPKSRSSDRHEHLPIQSMDCEDIMAPGIGEAASSSRSREESMRGMAWHAVTRSVADSPSTADGGSEWGNWGKQRDQNASYESKQAGPR